MISWCLLFVWLLAVLDSGNCQFSPQTYPDPRADPLQCRIVLPGQLCDPAEILLPEERRSLVEKIVRLQQITAQIRNTAPACANSQNSNLYIMVALIEKLGTLPYDVSLCDTLVLIVNSRMDRQVFTVAGRDAKLSREVLQTAFHRNVAHFRSGNYALGLEGMIEFIVSSYGTAHIIQVPSPGLIQGLEGASSAQLPSSNLPSSSSVGQFIAHGVRQKPEQKIPFEKFDLDIVPKDEKLWVQILLKATSQCGYDPEKITRHIRAVVEEAMTLSLKLIADPRYNKIEEDSQDTSKGSNARDKAWQNAKTSFLDSIYEKYGHKLPRRFEKCPDGGDSGSSDTDRRLL